MNYIFKTTATMKEYNNKKWYIDGGIVSDMRINADSVENALEIYRERVEEKHYITISKNAIKNKSEMFVDLSNGGIKHGIRKEKARRHKLLSCIPRYGTSVYTL
jgi:hypothetical protein